MKSKENPKADAPSSYDTHARSLHARAKKAHADWFASLSPDEKKRAKSMGVDSPPDDNTEVGGHSPFSVSDVADTPLARIDFDVSQAIDQPVEILAEQFNIPLQTAKEILDWHRSEMNDAIRSAEASHLQIIVGGLLSARNPKLSAAGLAFAGNLAALNGLPSQRDFARENHISPEAISKMVRMWSSALGLNPSVHQKSANACRIYSRIGKTAHWRSKKVSASALLKKLKSTPSNPSLN